MNRFVDRSVTKPQSSDDHSKPQLRNSVNANACMVDSFEPVNSYESIVHCDNDTHDNAAKSVLMYMLIFCRLMLMTLRQMLFTYQIALRLIVYRVGLRLRVIHLLLIAWHHCVTLMFVLTA